MCWIWWSTSHFYFHSFKSSNSPVKKKTNDSQPTRHVTNSWNKSKWVKVIQNLKSTSSHFCLFQYWNDQGRGGLEPLQQPAASRATPGRSSLHFPFLNLLLPVADGVIFSRSTHTHGSHWPTAMCLSSSSRSMFQCFLVPKHVCEPLLSQVPGHGLDWFDSNCSSFDRADTGEHFTTKLDRFWLYWAELFRPESGDSFNTWWSKGCVSFNSFTAKLFKLKWWNKHQFVVGIVDYRLICKLISSISNEWKILIFKSA